MNETESRRDPASFDRPGPKQVEPGQIVHHESGTSFNGRGAVDVYRAIVLASALRMYARSGIKANRAYTPTAMLKAAEEYVGHPFKRGQYAEAAEELSAWAAQARVGMDVTAEDRVKCGNCQWEGTAGQLNEAKDLDERLDFPIGHPDCIEPAGECPKCGALAYEVEA
jgi:hypothetical protein